MGRQVLVAELCGKVFSSILQTVEDWQETLGTGCKVKISMKRMRNGYKFSLNLLDPIAAYVLAVNG